MNVCWSCGKFHPGKKEICTQCTKTQTGLRYAMRNANCLKNQKPQEPDAPLAWLAAEDESESADNNIMDTVDPTFMYQD